MALAVAVAGAVPASAAEFRSGGYAFSDELGGFRLVSAAGRGTPGEPIVIVEELLQAAPVTLVIRRIGGRARAGFAPLTLEKAVRNGSRVSWVGFEVELQEALGEPSTYSDGLSFNQVGAAPPDVSSDAFADDDRLFEPYDRIRFERGHVDSEGTARFRLTITDPTPVSEFFLVQDPKLLSAARPLRRSYAARLDGQPRPEADEASGSAAPFRSHRIAGERSR